MLERESGGAVGVSAPELQSTMSCASCVTVVHSHAVPLHRGLGKIHAVTLWRRAVARLNRLVCNLTPGRAFAILYPQKIYLKRKGMSAALLTPQPPSKKEPSFLSGCASLDLDRHKWMKQRNIDRQQENSLSHQLARRNLWQANRHDFYHVELRVRLVKCVKQRPVSHSAPFQRSHAVINGQVFDCRDKWIQMNLGTRRRDCRTSHLDTK